VALPRLRICAPTRSQVCTGGESESDDGLECMGEKTRAERDAELRSQAVDLEDL
jgi:hypothetical protein